MTFRTRLRICKLVDDPRISEQRQMLATARRKHKSTARIIAKIFELRTQRMKEQRI